MWSSVCFIVPGWSQQTNRAPWYDLQLLTAMFHQLCQSLSPHLATDHNSTACQRMLKVCRLLRSYNTKQCLLLNNLWPNLPCKSVHVWSPNFPGKPLACPPAIWLWSGDCATICPATCLGNRSDLLASAGIKPGGRGAAFAAQEAQGGGFHDDCLIASASALRFSKSLSTTIIIKTGLCRRLSPVAAHNACPKAMLQFSIDFSLSLDKR